MSEMDDLTSSGVALESVASAFRTDSGASDDGDVNSRAIDSMIAEHVLGWLRWRCARYGVGVWPERDTRVLLREGYERTNDAVDDHDGTPLYTTDLAIAWRVVDAMREKWYWLQLTQVAARRPPWNALRWAAEFRYVGGATPGKATGRADALTAPLAICLAALSALDVDTHDPSARNSTNRGVHADERTHAEAKNGGAETEPGVPG
jgi:hypothetical protein